MRKIIYLFLAAVCVFYGLSIMALRSGSRFFLVWISLGAGFLLLFLGAQAGIWQKLPAAVRVLFLAGVILGAVLTAGASFLILRSASRRAEPDLDVILVLGAQVWEDGPSRVLQYRLDAAARYLETNERTLCIVSGGQGYNEPWTEAEGMFRYLTERGIAPDRILREDRSTNTTENIRFSRELVGRILSGKGSGAAENEAVESRFRLSLAGKDLTQADTGIVTNDFHLFRASAIARKQGLRHVSGIPAPSTAFTLPNNVFREVLGIMKDLLYGNLSLSD